MTPPTALPLLPLVYPESDGKPMAENTLQYQWIVAVRENLAAQYADRDDVLVAADNLIYPTEGNPRLCTAPDVYVAFGRPPGHRGSYRVWAEGGTFPQVIFEVLSPSNSQQEMALKLNFYRRFGAEEYYVIDPDAEGVEIRVRQGRRLVEVHDATAFSSPRLGIRFRWDEAETLVLVRADGTPFRSYLELDHLHAEAVEQAMTAVSRAADEQRRAEREKRRADREKRRADEQQQRADEQKVRAEKLAAKLRELGLDPDAA